jgi:hypothetical protein
MHKGACSTIRRKATDTAVMLAVPFEGGTEYVVQIQQDNCYCSPTGNCAVFVLAPRGRTFRVLLEGTSQNFVDILPSFSHGHPDLVLSMHDSATRSMDRTFRFDGKQYRQSECVYRNDTDGTTRPCQ